MQTGNVDYSLPTEMLVTMLPPLITIRQAVDMGAASERKLRLMCQKGEVRATKVGTDWRIARDPFLRQFGLVER